MPVALADLPERYRRQVLAKTGEAARLVPRDAPAPAPKPHKYGAHKREASNFRGGTRIYRSGWEATVAAQLEQEQRLGMWRKVVPEVSFIIGQADDGRDIRAIVDFLCVRPNGTIVLVEAKGFETAKGYTKRGVLKADGWDVETRVRPRRERAGRRG